MRPADDADADFSQVSFGAEERQGDSFDRQSAGLLCAFALQRFWSTRAGGEGIRRMRAQNVAPPGAKPTDLMPFNPSVTLIMVTPAELQVPQHQR